MVSQGRLVDKSQTGSETDKKSEAFKSSSASRYFHIGIRHHHTIDDVNDSIRTVDVRPEDRHFVSAPFKIVFYKIELISSGGKFGSTQHRTNSNVVVNEGGAQKRGGFFFVSGMRV